LASAGPYSREAGAAFALEPVSRAGDYERLLHLSQIPVQVLAMLLQVHDGVADQLAGPVEGDVAAALDFVQLDSSCGKERRGSGEMPGLRGTSHRHHGGMLHEQEHVLVDRS